MEGWEEPKIHLGWPETPMLMKEKTEALLLTSHSPALRRFLVETPGLSTATGRRGEAEQGEAAESWVFCRCSLQACVSVLIKSMTCAERLDAKWNLSRLLPGGSCIPSGTRDDGLTVVTQGALRSSLPASKSPGPDSTSWKEALVLASFCRRGELGPRRQW